MNICEIRRHHLNYCKKYILNQCTNVSLILEWHRPLQIVSHKNYNLKANEDFVMFMTSKLITCFIDGFTLGMKSQETFNLLSGSVHIYIYILKFGP